MIPERFVDYVGNSIRKNWNLPALSDYNGECLTYSETANHILRFHLFFDRLGIGKGDKIALVGKNSARWACVYLSVVSYGAVIVPILPDFKPDDIQSIINHSDSVLLFSSDTIFQSLDPLKMPALIGTISLNTFGLYHAGTGKLKTLIDSLDAEFVKQYPLGLAVDKFSLPDIGNDELAVISYTSGTTGFSKGVMLQHNSLAANVRYAQRNMPLKPGDPIVSFLPLAHSYGCAFEFLFPFSIGCNITILTKTPSPQIVIQAFQEIKPRLILSVPLVIEKIYKTRILPAISKFPADFMLHVPLVNKLIHNKIRRISCTYSAGILPRSSLAGLHSTWKLKNFSRKSDCPSLSVTE